MTKPLTKDQRKELFLAGMTTLTRRYRIRVGGCGCCGSPFLCEADDVKGRKYVEQQEYQGMLAFE